MPEGDADRHPGASGVFPSWRPGHNGIRGMVQQGAEQYGGIAGMQLSHGFGAGVPGGMRPGGHFEAGRQLVFTQRKTVRPSVAVVSRPGQEQCLEFDRLPAENARSAPCAPPLDSSQPARAS